MTDYTNLVYNGCFSSGVKYWSGSGITVTDNAITVTGNLRHTQMIPVCSNDTYKISFDIKFNTTVDTSFYIALIPLDSDKSQISISSTNKVSATGTNTTLAKALANGDTTVELTDGTGWDSTHTYQRIGICDNVAWGYNRNSVSAPYDSRSGNVLTLKSAWAGGDFPVGTKVANFRASSTYFYPISLSVNDASTEWKSYTATFKGGNSMRYSCQYFKFSTLAYNNNYTIRNIRIVNLTSHQMCDTTDISPQIIKSGNAAGVVNEVGRKIRYIKDSINGNTVNTANHWVEIQAYNVVGENIAFNKYYWKSSNTTKSKGIITDGNAATNPNESGGSDRIVDLGFVEQINSIKVWHYWGDGRTYYDNKVEVSVDGTNWDTVYFGSHVETQYGFEIPLYPIHTSFSSNGLLTSSEVIEIW